MNNIPTDKEINQGLISELKNMKLILMRIIKNKKTTRKNKELAKKALNGNRQLIRNLMEE